MFTVFGLLCLHHLMTMWHTKVCRNWTSSATVWRLGRHRGTSGRPACGRRWFGVGATRTPTSPHANRAGIPSWRRHSRGWRSYRRTCRTGKSHGPPSETTAFHRERSWRGGNSMKTYNVYLWIIYYVIGSYEIININQKILFFAHCFSFTVCALLFFFIKTAWKHIMFIYW